jgi:hypothetical protein
MSMIFPGMDPNLEDPWLWPGVHASLIVYIRDLLNPSLQPRYVALVEGRLYLEGSERRPRPDVVVQRTARPRSQWAAETSTMVVDRPVRVVAAPEEIVETYIAILDRKHGKKVVTVIEVLSPTNKVAGAGRDSYLQKQREVDEGYVHLVEIDLLRLGAHVLSVPEGLAKAQGPYDYLVCVNRAEGTRNAFELYPLTIRDRLPRIAIPLADDDPDIALDIQAAFDKTYELGFYRGQLDYTRPCEPPLSADDQAWADAQSRAASE